MEGSEMSLRQWRALPRVLPLSQIRDEARPCGGCGHGCLVEIMPGSGNIVEAIPVEKLFLIEMQS